MRFALPLAAILILGCKEPPKETPAAAPSASAPAKATAPSASASVVASAAPSASASAGAGHSETCEVEIFGKVIFPQGMPKGKKAVVYVAQDDCLADNAQILGHVDAGIDGGIVIEVFPKWGTDITICAALDEGEGKPTSMYGKAKGKFHAEAEGEVTFADVKVELAKGKPHVFPADAKEIKPSKAPSNPPPK